ncbi:MAG: TolC family protein [Hymenobacteraceae bacterium]|nr:TolC family protein [Hymenobacteraceae bacterium]
MRIRSLFSSLLLVSLLVAASSSIAQTPATGQPVATSEPLRLSLPQAVDYALTHKSTLQAQRLNEEIAKARVGEIRSIGLPQITAGTGTTDNIKLQKSLVDFSAFGGPPLTGTQLTPDQLAAAQAGQTVTLKPAYGEVVRSGPQPIAFGLQWQGNAAIQGSQLLFDGSYLIGLKAAKVYEQLSVKQTQQSEIDVVENVTKAYYGVLVNRERFDLLARNVARLDTIYRQTAAIYKEGFVEKLDVDRLQVQLTNLKVEQQKTERLVDLTVALLKFQMGLDQRQPVELTDRLEEAVQSAQLTAPDAAANGFNYGDRVEYSVLETQRDLAALDVRNKRAGYLPRLLATGGYGFVGSDPTAKGLLQFRGPDSRNAETGFANQNWFGFANVGLQLHVPIFDGFQKRYALQQAKLTARTVNYGFTTLQQAIDLQQAQGRIGLLNAVDVLKNQQANMTLATDVARVAKIKFQEGVGSNLEVITAETDLRAAQTNYYSSVYDALVAKVEFEKAQGTLKK